MDAPAILLGEQTFEGIFPDQLVQGELAFNVLVETPIAGASCAVRVHLDLDRDGVVSVGDYVSTEHIAVLQNADAHSVRVSVSRVR